MAALFAYNWRFFECQWNVKAAPLDPVALESSVPAAIYNGHNGYHRWCTVLSLVTNTTRPSNSLSYATSAANHSSMWAMSTDAAELTPLKTAVDNAVSGGAIVCVIDGSGSYSSNSSLLISDFPHWIAELSKLGNPMVLVRYSGYDDTVPTSSYDWDGSPIQVGGDGTAYGDDYVNQIQLTAKTLYAGVGELTPLEVKTLYDSNDTGNANDSSEPWFEGVRHGCGHAKALGYQSGAVVVFRESSADGMAVEFSALPAISGEWIGDRRAWE
jgi:hypothetical protein